jgi:hypothetical protein
MTIYMYRTQHPKLTELPSKDLALVHVFLRLYKLLYYENTYSNFFLRYLFADLREINVLYEIFEDFGFSVGDPDPYNPYVVGPPGSFCQRYGSGSLYHQSKKVRKTLIPIVL